MNHRAVVIFLGKVIRRESKSEEKNSHKFKTVHFPRKAANF